METVGLSERVRSLAKEQYVRPAHKMGHTHLSIKVRDILNDVGREGSSQGRTPIICQVLKGQKFLKENGLEIESVDGPPSKQSPTVVVHYRVVQSIAADSLPTSVGCEQFSEDSAAWAARLTGKLRGLLKDEIASCGGAEALVKWIRSEDEDAA